MTPQPNKKTNTTEPTTMKYLSFKQFIAEGDKKVDVATTQNKESK